MKPDACRFTLPVSRVNMTTDIRESSAQLRKNFRNSMRRLLSVASIVVLVSACDNENRVLSPTSPSPSSPTSPAAPVLTYTLSGVVFEMTAVGRTPIQEVSVYCDSCGDPLGHTFSDTDANGFYSFSWTANGHTALIVRKDGYRLAGNPPAGPVDGWIVAAVNGDTRFDIELVQR
jgi:hypothetical protein